MRAGVVKFFDVLTGMLVSPTAPWYHWYDSVAVPEASTVRFADVPATMLWLRGWSVTAGAVQPGPDGEMVIVLLSAEPQAFVTRTQ